MFKRVIVGGSLLAGLAASECANGCSGHGACGNRDQCICYDGYTASDCSQRICPHGLSFVDVPKGDLNHDGLLGGSGSGSVSGYSHVQWSRYKQAEYWPTLSGVESAVAPRTDGNITPETLVGGGYTAAKDEAHFYSECSGKGACDRETGVCQCYDGYTGSACQRTVCPNSCSGHGYCRTVAEIAQGALNKRFLQSTAGQNYYSGVQEPFTYRLWDADKNTACVCDPGYSGIDCSLRECPRGDDPLTAIQPTCGNKDCADEVQGFTITSGSDNTDYAIKFHDFFSNTWYTTPYFKVRTAAGNTANPVTIKNALEALPNNVTGIVKVSTTSVPGAGRVLVTFTSLPGNVPEMEVMRKPGSAGADPAAQPSQPLHFFTVLTSDLTSTDGAFTAYPLDITGFRPAQFTTTTAAALDTVLKIQTALQGATAGIPALTYDVGTTSIDVATSVSGSNTVIAIRMPNKQWGTNPMKLAINGKTYYSTLDTKDGNKEFAMCSNRGMCDFTSGLCQCFPGYVGNACEQQNALAM